MMRSLFGLIFFGLFFSDASTLAQGAEDFDFEVPHFEEIDFPPPPDDIEEGFEEFEDDPLQGLIREEEPRIQGESTHEPDWQDEAGAAESTDDGLDPSIRSEPSIGWTPAVSPSEELTSEEFRPISTSRYRFHQNQERAWVLSALVELELPRDISGREISYTFQSQAFGQSGRRIGIAMSATREALYDSQSELLSAVRLTHLREPIQTQGCKDHDLEIEVTPSLPQGVFVGLHCEVDVEASKLRFWLSLPSDVTWREMSLFETAGKGERWSEYRLDNFAPSIETQSLASFQFFFEEEIFQIRLIQKPNAELLKRQEIQERELRALQSQSQMFQTEAERLQRENIDLQKTVEKQKEMQKYFHASLMLGGGMIGVKTVSVNETSFQPTVALDLATIPLMYSLGVGARFKYVFPPGASNLWDISVGGQSSWTFGNFKLRPGLGFHVFGNDVSSQGLAFRHTAMNFDLYAEYGKRWQIWSLISGSGFLPVGESKYISAMIGYRRSWNAFFLWGFEFGYQRTTFSDVNGSFQQILGSASISY